MSHSTARVISEQTYSIAPEIHMEVTACDQMPNLLTTGTLTSEWTDIVKTKVTVQIYRLNFNAPHKLYLNVQRLL